MDNLLTAENIAVSFGNKEVLKGVSLRAEQGKITGLLGRNGCGKSTLLKVIFGTLQVQDKIIQINRKTVAGSLYSKTGVINYMPQTGFFPSGISVKRVLKDFKLNVDDILIDFPSLESDVNKKIEELSGGTERLWALLILLLADTQFTLLDEPFTHIMPLHIDKVKELLQKIKRKKGIILTDHMYRHLTSVSDSLHLIKGGNSVSIHSIDELALHGYISVHGI